MYGRIIVMEGMSYAQALPLYGLRQNVFTDPQKPMRLEPGILPSERRGCRTLYVQSCSTSL
ncbi:MAG: hypothetical protein V8S32_03155 [Lachnospiraceae bacterium]